MRSHIHLRCFVACACNVRYIPSLSGKLVRFLERNRLGTTLRHNSVDNLTIITPISYWRNCHPILERFPSILLQSFQCHKSAVTPSPNGHTGPINVRLFTPGLCCLNLVMGFIMPKIASYNTFELAPIEPSTSTIDSDDDIAQVRSNIGLKIDEELFANCLRPRAAVKLE